MKARIRELLIDRGITRAAIFGSVARNEDTEGSDLDLLIDPPKEMTLLDLSDLKIDLEEALGERVDVVTYNSINPRLRSIILSEQEVII